MMAVKLNHTYFWEAIGIFQICQWKLIKNRNIVKIRYSIALITYISEMKSYIFTLSYKNAKTALMELCSSLFDA